MAKKEVKRGPAGDSAVGESLTTRERILQVALEVFAEKGLHGATMSEIAKRAGLTGGALYRYFDNKEGVFQAVVESRSMAFTALDMVRDLIPELEPGTAIKFLIQGMFTYFYLEADFMRVVVGESVKDPAVAGAFFEKMLAPSRDFVRECVVLWQEKGLLRESVDPLLATMAFMGMTGYLMVEQALFANPELAAYEPARLAEDYSGLFLTGILK
jgi:AcrR family transcriptional regulator